MKHDIAIIPVSAALILSGCISVLPKQRHAVPRYDVSIPEVPSASAATGEKAATPAIFVLGRVRAADEASGRAIRTVDVPTGRTGILTDGELALSTEAIVGAFLRARLAAVHPDAIVCDASVAPRSGDRTTVDAWIERFRLEKREGAWFFKAAIRIVSVAPDGSITATDSTPSVLIPMNGGSRPTAEEAVRAISSALASIEP
jgi:hypothetical protein